MVPDLELRESAVYCHYTPVEFTDLPWQERAACVAQYRLHRLIEMHMQDAINEASERRMRQSK